MIQFLLQNASLDGNQLLDIGPDASGEIQAPSIRRPGEMGAWLSAHGGSNYGTRPIDEAPLRNGDG